MAQLTVPTRAFYLERTLKNGWKTRLELRPRASSGLYSSWVSIPPDIILSEVKTSSEKDDLPIGLTENKELKISIDLGYLYNLINSEPDTEIKEDLTALLEFINDPMYLAGTALGGKLIKRKVYNTWLLFIEPPLSNSQFSNLNTVKVKVSGISPSTNDEYTWENTDGSIGRGFIRSYKLISGDIYEVVLTNENGGEILEAGSLISGSLEELTYTQGTQMKWILEACCVQKDNIEREVAITKLQNVISLELSDSIRYSLEQITYDILGHKGFEVGGYRKTMSLSRTPFYVNNVSDIKNFYFDKLDFQFQKQENNVNTKDDGTAIEYELIPRFLKVDKLFDLIFDKMFYWWNHYCMHEIDTPTWDDVKIHSKYPYYFHNFFQQLYDESGGDVKPSGFSNLGIVWKWNSSNNSFDRNDTEENPNELYILTSFYDEDGVNISRGGFLTDVGEDSFGKSYTNCWEFLTDVAESAGVCANLSIKSFQPTTEWDENYLGATNYYFGGYYPQFTDTFLVGETVNSTNFSRFKIPKFTTMINPSFKIGYSVLKSCKVTTSGYSSEDNDKIVNCEYENLYSKGNAEWNVKSLIFNTSPNAAVEYGKYDMVFRNDDDSIETRMVQNKNRYGTARFNIRKIFHKNTTESNVTKFIKVFDQPILFQNYLNEGATSAKESYGYYLQDLGRIYKFYVTGITTLPAVDTTYRSTSSSDSAFPIWKVVDFEIDDIGNGYINFKIDTYGDNAFSMPKIGATKLYNVSGTGDSEITFKNLDVYDFVHLFPHNLPFTQQKLLDNIKNNIELIAKYIKAYQERGSYQNTLAHYIVDTFSKPDQILLEYEVDFDNLLSNYSGSITSNIDFAGSQQVGNISFKDPDVLTQLFPTEITDIYGIENSSNFALMSVETDFDKCRIKHKWFMYGKK